MRVAYRILSGLPLLFLALAFGVELAAILRLNSGHFTYTLDDPYIHLALAQRIHMGHYGINPGEPSAPSSTFLWPFLLAPLAGTRFFEFVPLIVGILAAGATAMVYKSIIRTSFGAASLRSRPGVFALILIALVVITNLVGLAFTGMENSLQVLLTGLVMLGIVREMDTGRVSTSLVAAIALGPAIRYESLGVSIAAILYLFLRGHRRAAVVAGSALLVLLGLFSLFLARLGIGLLPTSVLLKAPMFTSTSIVHGVLANLKFTLRDPVGVLLALGGIWMLCIVLFSARDSADRILAGSMGVAIVLHALTGRYGAYHRWEMYIVTASALTLLHLERRSVSAIVRTRSTPQVAVAVALMCVVIGGRYLFGLSTIPVAANNIYEQQYQMHRFVLEEERRPVAVNDLGYVSFGNPCYVLDLLGLGTPGILAQPEGPARAALVERAVSAHGIETSMLYEGWFENLPRAWVKVGELHLSRTRITPSWERVSFYATSEAVYPAVRARVLAFEARLPPRVRFTFAR